LRGALAYVANEANGLAIADVSNLSAPVQVGAVDTPGTAYDVALSPDGSHAYVADWTAGVAVINVMNPANPILVGNVPVAGGNLSGVAVSGTHLYVGAGFPGLLIFNIANPASPTLVGTADTPGFARHLAVSSNLVYVADDQMGLKVVNAANPSAPVIVGSADTPSVAMDLAITGTTAFVADFDSGVQIVSIAIPSVPVIIDSIPTLGSSTDVSIFGTTLYVALGLGGVQLFDIANVSAPTSLGGVATEFAQGILATASAAFLADFGGGLKVLHSQCAPSAAVNGETEAQAPTQAARLHAASPNPFRGETAIRYELAARSRVTFHIYDVGGHRVRALETGAERPPGTHGLIWDGRDDQGRALASGIYLGRLTAGEEARDVVRLVLTR